LMQMDLDPHLHRGRQPPRAVAKQSNPWIAGHRAEEEGADTLYRLRATTK
jgi:hypothetical protein